MYLCHGCYKGAEAASAIKKSICNEKKAGARSPGLINIHLYHFPQYHSSMISYLNQSKSVWLCDVSCPAEAYIPITGQS